MMHMLRNMVVITGMAVVLVFIVIIEMYRRQVKEQIVQLPTGYKPESGMQPYY